MKYELYLQEKEALSFEEMNTIYTSIFDNGNPEHKDFKLYWAEVVNAAVSYTAVRAEWSIRNPKDNDRRSPKHNALITAFLVLERIFKLNGWSSFDWTEKLFLAGELEEMRTLIHVNQHRRRIGDFGNYVVLMQALETRGM